MRAEPRQTSPPRPGLRPAVVAPYSHNVQPRLSGTSLKPHGSGNLIFVMPSTPWSSDSCCSPAAAHQWSGAVAVTGGALMLNADRTGRDSG